MHRGLDVFLFAADKSPNLVTLNPGELELSENLVLIGRAGRAKFNKQLLDTSTSYPEYSLSFDLSSLSALNDDPVVYFRVVDNSTTAINGGTVKGGSKMDLLDNFIVAASPVPEPSTLCLFGVPGLAFILARQRRRTRDFHI